MGGILGYPTGGCCALDHRGGIHSKPIGSAATVNLVHCRLDRVGAHSQTRDPEVRWRLQIKRTGASTQGEAKARRLELCKFAESSGCESKWGVG